MPYLKFMDSRMADGSLSEKASITNHSWGSVANCLMTSHISKELKRYFLFCNFALYVTQEKINKESSYL